MTEVLLTPDDVAGIRFGHSAVWETTASLYALTDPSAQALHRPLRRRLSARARAVALDLADLTSVPGWVPDTLSPPPRSVPADPRTELEDIVDTDVSLVGGDLETLRRARPAGRWASMGPAQFVEELATVLVDYWSRELAPRWEAIEAVNKADVQSRSSGLARDGVGRALHRLHPGVSYTRSVLRIEMPLHACRSTGNGKGVWLVPSVFRWPKVGLALTPDQPLVVSYPAAGAGTIWEARRGSARGLEGLIGRSRAAVLQHLTVPRTTTGLARRLELAPATVSAHLSTLATAGLVVGSREGRLVLYSRTALGTQLVDAELPADELADAAGPEPLTARHHEA